MTVVTKENEQQNITVVETGKAYTFSMPMSSVTVSAQFEVDPNPPDKPDEPDKPNTWTYTSSASEKRLEATWASDQNGWRYRKNGSYIRSSWEFIDYNGTKNWYYLNPISDGTRGSMASGWKQIDGRWYYFNEVSNGTKGALLTDTVTPDGYYVNADGVRVDQKNK